MRPIARRWSRRSSEARYPPRTGWCAGGSPIWRRCSGTISRYRFRGRRGPRAAGCGLRASGARLPQTVRPAQASRAGPGRDRGLQKGGFALKLHQPGWHLTPKLEPPADILIVAIPSKSPELDVQENVWRFMHDNLLSNRVFGSCDEIADHCCNASNKLLDQPSRIMSHGPRKWAQRS